MALSHRAVELAKPDPRYQLWEILQDAWHPTTNPGGIISLGVAENALMHDVLAEHIHKHISLPEIALTYGDSTGGSKRLKSAMAKFLTKHLKPVVPIEPSHVTVTNGCSSAVEHLSWALANPGEAFLLGQPYYGTFVSDFMLRTGVKLEMVAFRDVDPVSVEALAKYEEKIEEAKTKGQKIAGVVIAHPHNPLGRCYPREFLVRLMKLCQKHQIHLVSDEVYALSTFPNTVDKDVPVVQFESVLSIDTTDIVDPALLHIVWGLSKDFGANGIRLGALISQRNPTLHAAIVPVALYSSPSSISEHVSANVLEDEAWTEEYIQENQRRLGSNYEHVTRWARENGIGYKPGVNAAFFLWTNLGEKYRRARPGEEIADRELDQAVMDALLRQKIFLASGAPFGSEVSGWFRIVFSQKREYLDRGLERITAAMGERVRE